MEQHVVVGIMQNAIWTVILTSAPPLIFGLVLGITVALFQAVTSIQEATLAFVPKILAVFLALMIFGSYMLDVLTGFTTTLFLELPQHLSN